MATAVKHKHLSQYLSFQSRFTENACFQDYNLKSPLISQRWLRLTGEESNVHLDSSSKIIQVMCSVLSASKTIFVPKNWVTIIQELQQHKIKTEEIIITAVNMFKLHDKNPKILLSL